MNRQQRDEVDPRLAAAYAELRQATPEADWERLSGAIRDRAKPLLSRRQARRFMRISRPLVPLAAAASVAFALWIGPRLLIHSPQSDSYAAVSVYEDDAVLLEALVADLSEQEFRNLVTGRANPEALLAVAAGAR